MLFLLFMFIRPWIILLSSHLLPSPRPKPKKRHILCVSLRIVCAWKSMNLRVCACVRYEWDCPNWFGSAPHRIVHKHTHTHTSSRFTLGGRRKEWTIRVNKMWWSWKGKVLHCMSQLVFHVQNMWRRDMELWRMIESTWSAQDVYYIGVKKQTGGNLIEFVWARIVDFILVELIWFGNEMHQF